MARIVRGGLIQASNPEPGTSSVKKIKQAMIEKHITLIEQEHIPSPQGDTFLMGVIWWDSTKNQLGGMECNSYLPVTCDLKGGLNDITISWDGTRFQIDELETHNGRHTVWHESWTNITPDSFTQTGDVTRPDGTSTRFMTVHGRRVKELKSIGAE